jgi:hypothetical protein
VRLEGFVTFKNHLIGYRTRDLPVCSIVTLVTNQNFRNVILGALLAVQLITFLSLSHAKKVNIKINKVRETCSLILRELHKLMMLRKHLSLRGRQLQKTTENLVTRIFIICLLTPQ